MLLLPFLGLAATTSDSTVYIIRHGEKTWAAGCLSADGQARAGSLPTTFDGLPSTNHSTFSVPQALFAYHYDDAIDCERCRQTLSPISAKLNVSIDFDFGRASGNGKAAEAIRNATLAGVATVLVAWEHVNIQWLTADLGVPKAQIPTWQDSDYDSVYVLTLSAAGTLANFSVSAEHFTPSSLVEAQGSLIHGP